MNRRPRLVSLLRASILGLAAGVMSWPLSVGAGVMAAVLGALIGALAGDRLSRSRLRTASVLSLALAAAVFAVVVARWWVRASWPAELAGPVMALAAGEAMLWLALLLPGVLALRLVAARRPSMAVLEVILVGVALVASVAAHRDLKLHRPLWLGDWAWSRGLSPELPLLALGGLGSLVLAALLLRRGRRGGVVEAGTLAGSLPWVAAGRQLEDSETTSSGRRLLLHFLPLLLVALAFLLLVRPEDLPGPSAGGGLGLTGDPAEAEPGEGGRGQRRERGGQSLPQLGDLQFKDQYQSDGRQSPVAVVVLHDDYAPPSGVYYFRQAVFSQYNGRRLVQATRDDVDLDVVHYFPSSVLRLDHAPPLSEQRRALHTSTGLLVDHVKPFALDSPVELRPSRNPSTMRFQRAFEAVSHVQVLPYQEMLGQRPGAADWDEQVWRHYTEAPNDPRYAELAATMTSILHEDYRDDPLGQALAVKAYLDREGIYSLNSKHAGAADPAASFLFGDLTGYCVHFAHAATYLLRTLGVPARVASGYAVAEAARGGGSAVMIRGADAHAWPEIYLEGVGWVVVDLAPERTLDDAVEDPDQALQRMLGEMMRQARRPLEEDQLAAAFNLRRWARWLGILALLLGLAAALVKLYRRVAPRFVGAGELYRVAYRAALDRLAEIGLRRRFGESREHFARRVEATSPAFVDLTGGHLAAAFGSRRVESEVAWRQLSSKLGEQLRHRVPAWRRLLGLANPFSWLGVH